MRKILFSLLLAVIAVGMSVVFTSCGSDDDERDERLSNIPRLIEVTSNIKSGFGVEDYQQGDILTSDNLFVAEVLDNGRIRLNHTGKVNITHNKRTYVVTVQPRSNYYEPYLKFGASRSDVIEYEKRTLKGADGNELVYEGDGSFITGVGYIFGDNGKLINVILIFNHFEGLWDEVWKGILNERYAEATKTDGSIIYLNNFPNKADMMITYTPYMKGYKNNGTIIFSPYK